MKWSKYNEFSGEDVLEKWKINKRNNKRENICPGILTLDFLINSDFYMIILYKNKINHDYMCDVY